MAIEFVCPSCGGTLRVGDETAGQVIRCGGCMSALRVPIPAPPAAPPPPPPPPHAAPDSPFETAAPPPRRVPDRNPTDVEPLPERDDDLPTAYRVDPDAPDERRRRPLPPPPPASGGRIVVWLLVIGGIGFVGLIGCCAGVFMLLPGPEWREHKSTDGGFKVELPAEPQPDVERAANIRLEAGGKSEGAQIARRVQQYMVIYRDIPGTKDREAAGGSDEKQIDLAVAKLTGAPETKFKGDPKNATVGGFPMREIEFQGRTGWYVARIIVADTRQYVLIVHGVTRPSPADVHRFMNSFEITDPVLVAEGKRRAADAKNAQPPEKKGKPKDPDENEPKRD